MQQTGENERSSDEKPPLGVPITCMAMTFTRTFSSCKSKKKKEELNNPAKKKKKSSYFTFGNEIDPKRRLPEPREIDPVRLSVGLPGGELLAIPDRRFFMVALVRLGWFMYFLANSMRVWRSSSCIEGDRGSLLSCLPLRTETSSDPFPSSACARVAWKRMASLEVGGSEPISSSTRSFGKRPDSSLTSPLNQPSGVSSWRRRRMTEPMANSSSIGSWTE